MFDPLAADPVDPSYRAGSTFIDVDHPAIVALARELKGAGDDDTTYARRAFEYVRDRIPHSLDVGARVLTCRASTVLNERTGYCYAKSHLLVALLRAGGLPAGLCYQRLTLGEQPPYCLHGLVAVHLPVHGWYRVDARGNKPGVDAAFDPPRERLAFVLRDPGERDYPGVYAEPWPEVIDVLTRHATVQDALAALPDVGFERANQVG